MTMSVCPFKWTTFLNAVLGPMDSFVKDSQTVEPMNQGLRTEQIIYYIDHFLNLCYYSI